MSTLTITVRTDPSRTAYLSPVGEIDGDNAHEIRDAVSGLLMGNEAPRMIKVEMAGVAFIDSVGIGALVHCYHTAAASGVRLALTNPTPYVHRLLYVSGLLGLFGSPARPPEHQPV